MDEEEDFDLDCPFPPLGLEEEEEGAEKEERVGGVGGRTTTEGEDGGVGSDVVGTCVSIVRASRERTEWRAPATNIVCLKTRQVCVIGQWWWRWMECGIIGCVDVWDVWMRFVDGDGWMVLCVGWRIIAKRWQLGYMDALILASHGWIIAVDNLSRVVAWFVAWFVVVNVVAQVDSKDGGDV